MPYLWIAIGMLAAVLLALLTVAVSFVRVLLALSKVWR